MLQIKNISSLKCFECQSYNDENCLNPDSNLLKSCPTHYVACAIYRSIDSGKEAVIRSCALKVLKDDCSDTSACMAWCDSDGCNRSFKAKSSLVLILFAFFIILKFNF
ncbi:unnamed protein product [Brachionus calyciflorus]|uniref:Uncharacterized protein n=1 Tax=Brachionus calyciflorus TaxID=104777 RepID=A0A813MG68_9BILA|nr:unnamed protein product [Brachionus calyciflorus]